MKISFLQRILSLTSTWKTEHAMECVGSRILIYDSRISARIRKKNESGAFFNRNACFTMDLVTLGLGWSVAELCATWDYGDLLASRVP